MKKFTRIEPTTKHKIGWRETVVKTFKDNDGKIFEFATWGGEAKEHAATIALTKDNKIITTYQFRPGPEKWMYELPGGGLNKGEEPIRGALRELSEETGYSSVQVKMLGTVGRDAYINGLWHFTIAYKCEPIPGGQNLDHEESEQGAQVKLITIEDLINNAKSGLMTDTAAVLMAYDELLKIKGDTK